MSRSVVFLSDFGYRNEWVGICHVVINRLAPESTVIDLSHGVPPLDVRAGALVLADSLPYIRHDAIVLGVVDPSVGRHRDIAVETGDGRLLSGPTTVCSRRAGAPPGAPPAPSRSRRSQIVLEPVSPSLHARDVLAPAAAHLAAGGALDELGEPVDVESLAGPSDPRPQRRAGEDRVRGARPEPLRELQPERPELAPRRGGARPRGTDRRRLAGGGGARAAGVDLRRPRGRRVGPDGRPRGWLSVIRENPHNAAADLAVGTGDLVWLTTVRD